MRGFVYAVVILAGCGAPVRPIDVTTPPTNGTESPPPMSAEAYEAKMAGLRATLARNHIALDTQAVFETCTGSDTHGRCVRCDVAHRDDTGGLDPDMIDAISIAFARYPDAALAAMKLDHVALCSKIRFSGDKDTGPAGIAVVGGARVLLSIEHFHGELRYESFTIEQVVHHELFHMLDAATLGDRTTGDREWLALNPPGFAYVDPAERDKPRPPGFVDRYATTNELEDRATVFEYLMGQPDKLCEIAKQDMVVAAKTTVVWKRAAPVVGDALLRRSAPCVDWVERPVAKPAVKKPRPRHGTMRR